LINLVDNAIKYSAGAPKVTLKVSRAGSKLWLEVADNGIGIERKNLKRVFLPFYRVPSGNVHNVKGSGLGLSYVKKICDLHKWKIMIESEPGKGTTVRIIIPKA
jgi:two-component system phosphate regulon sensor histidine kinase PhoR